VDMGKVKITMPAGFEIGSYTAIKSSSASSVHQDEPVTIHPDRNAAYVDLSPGQMLSVKFIKK